LKNFRIQNIIAFLLGIAIYIVMDISEDGFVKALMRARDIFVFLNGYIVWSAIKMISLGLIVGSIVAFLMPIFSFFLQKEMKLENLFGRNIILLDMNSHITIDRILFYAYLLFAPTVILTKLFVALKSGDMFKYYMMVGELSKHYLWLLLIILVTPYLLVDKSRLRNFDTKKLLMKYPSLFLSLFAVVILGGGSVVSLVPIYYDLLSIFRDPILTLQLFIYSIVYFYLPSLGCVIGYLIAGLYLNKNKFKVAVELLEKGFYNKIMGLEAKQGT